MASVSHIFDRLHRRRYRRCLAGAVAGKYFEEQLSTRNVR